MAHVQLRGLCSRPDFGIHSTTRRWILYASFVEHLSQSCCQWRMSLSRRRRRAYLRGKGSVSDTARVVASLANLSAFSLPSTPTCALTQRRRICGFLLSVRRIDRTRGYCVRGLRIEYILDTLSVRMSAGVFSPCDCV